MPQRLPTAACSKPSRPDPDDTPGRQDEDCHAWPIGEPTLSYALGPTAPRSTLPRTRSRVVGPGSDAQSTLQARVSAAGDEPDRQAIGGNGGASGAAWPSSNPAGAAGMPQPTRRF